MSQHGFGGFGGSSGMLFLIILILFLFPGWPFVGGGYKQSSTKQDNGGRTLPPLVSTRVSSEEISSFEEKDNPLSGGTQSD